jgi:hypothetical protein
MEPFTSQTSRISQLNLSLSALNKAIILSVVYIFLLFVLPIGHETVGSYHLSNFDYRILRFAVNLPSIFLWIAAFIGYGTLQQYSKLIQTTAEGSSYNRLANGVMWLAWSLPITSLTSLITSSISYRRPSFHAAGIIITNYVSLILPLIAFSLIGLAARQISSTVHNKFYGRSSRTTVLLFLLIGILYCCMTFSHFSSARLNSSNNPYFLPIWLMILTVVIPYLYAWLVGLLAAYGISIYSQQIAGLLYQRALRLLVVGLIIIICASIAMQYLNGVEPRTGHLILNTKLLVNVILRIISGAGFVLLTIGALRLKKIEEI